MEPNVKAELKIICAHNGHGKFTYIGKAKHLRKGYGWDIDVRPNQKDNAALRAVWDPSDDWGVFVSKLEAERERRNLPKRLPLREQWIAWVDSEGNLYPAGGKGRVPRWRLRCPVCRADVQFRMAGIERYLNDHVTRGAQEIDLCWIGAKLASSKTE